MALFNHDELSCLREMPDEVFRAVHAAKRAFPGSKIIGWVYGFGERNIGLNSARESTYGPNFGADLQR